MTEQLAIVRQLQPFIPNAFNAKIDDSLSDAFQIMVRASWRNMLNKVEPCDEHTGTKPNRTKLKDNAKIARQAQVNRAQQRQELILSILTKTQATPDKLHILVRVKTEGRTVKVDQIRRDMRTLERQGFVQSTMVIETGRNYIVQRKRWSLTDRGMEFAEQKNRGNGENTR